MGVLLAYRAYPLFAYCVVSIFAYCACLGRIIGSLPANTPDGKASDPIRLALKQ